MNTSSEGSCVIQRCRMFNPPKDLFKTVFSYISLWLRLVNTSYNCTRFSYFVSYFESMLDR